MSNTSARRSAAATMIGMAMFAAAPAAAQTTGGVASPEAPRIAAVTCPAGAPCRRGAELVITGSALSEVRRVIFRGAHGRRDDRAAVPRRATANELAVVIPARARSGPIVVQGALRGQAARWPAIRIAAGRPASDAERLAGKVFLDGEPARFSYAAQAGQAIELVALATGAVIQRWPAQPDASGSGQMTWDGRIGGRHADPGAYAFRVAGAQATAASSAGRSARFELLDHIFPIRGAHDLGQSATNSFGGGRGHQGQDMFAACGTRLVAARGGVVTEAKFDDRAGNFAVITDDTGVSNVYMHMRDRALIRRGERVLTGQPIGFVGDTGRAEGCHLHFELWTAPGWYQGGEPIDALPELRRWDAAT